MRLMRRMRCAEWVVLGGLLVMVWMGLASLLAQSMPVMTQDGINAMLVGRYESLGARLDRIENILQGIVVGVFVQLIALLFYMLKGRRVRGEDY